MVRRALQHCCKRGSSREPVTTYIWISDDSLRKQWLKFNGCHRSYTTSRSRRLTKPSAPTSQSASSTIVSQRNKFYNKSNDGVLYQSRRHGSAAPGPLEARRRRALRKHITGASNLGIFGCGLDFSGSSWRGENRRLGEGISKQGESLYNAIGMIWRWWLLDPDAPARAEENMFVSTPETIPMDSFETFLDSLSLEFTTRPKTIRQLLELVFSSGQIHNERLLQATCNWIRAEVSLGSMTEHDMKSVLWIVSQDYSRRHNKFEDFLPRWTICRSVAQGLLESKIRTVKDLASESVWMLLRSIALTQPSFKDGLSMAVSLIQSINDRSIDAHASMLQSFIETILTGPGPYSGHFITSLKEALPADGLSKAVIKAYQNQIRAYKAHRSVNRGERLLVALSELETSGLIKQMRQHSLHQVELLQLERELHELGHQFTTAYLSKSSEVDVCNFVLKHVIAPSKGAERASVHHSSVLKAQREFNGLVSDQQTFTQLIHLIESFRPENIRNALKFLYTYLRRTERMTDCYELSRYIFSRKNLRARLPFEVYQEEASLWAEKFPLFAVVLLAIDHRRGSTSHPLISRTLSKMSVDLDRLPVESIWALAHTMIKSHGANVKVSNLRRSTLASSDTLLQLLLQPISWGLDDGVKSFRLAQKIVRLLKPASERLKKESSIALTNIVAVKALEARQKIPNWKLEWLANIVTELEGPEVWKQTFHKIEQWWEAIEIKEEEDGRKWKHGVGWVQK